jgi:hypothetical protein
MAETLGSLCDKLTIVKLKEYHTENEERLKVLSIQANQLQVEINEFVTNAVNGQIPLERLTFAANKVFKQGENLPKDAKEGFGEVFYQLADVNCKLWHEQEKVYEFEKVPDNQKDVVVEQLALLNLERNNCIDSLNTQFLNLIKSNI